MKDDLHSYIILIDNIQFNIALSETFQPVWITYSTSVDYIKFICVYQKKMI